jgi:hypothetical protein
MPLHVIAQRLGAGRSVVVAHEFDHVLLLGQFPLGRETGAFRVERQYFFLSIESAFVQP